jgi:TPP-dependent trihydroxycyclohexane-1,2-dione (THcHDO) dehydratase
MTKNTTTRRAVLAGAAAMPAIAMPAAVFAATTPDPIFPALDHHRKSEAAYLAACNEPTGDEATEQARETRVFKLCDKSSDALGELVAMTPTTVAGCAALLRYLEAHEKTYDDPILLDNHSDNVSVPARDLLSRIAAALEAAVQS